MEALLAGIEAAGPASALRVSRWGYAAVNAAHIFGIALLVGAILPLDLRLLGVWRSVPRTSLVRVLVPVAVAGLAVVLITGPLLFSVRAREYAAIGFLQAKIVLVAVGVLSALALHGAHGFLLEGASRSKLTVHAIISMTCWLGALGCGRLIAFAGG